MSCRNHPQIITLISMHVTLSFAAWKARQIAADRAANYGIPATRPRGWYERAYLAYVNGGRWRLASMQASRSA